MLIPLLARIVAGGLPVLILGGLGSAAQSPPTAPDARVALLQGRVGVAEQMLRSALARSPGDAQNALLLCRVLYAEDRFEEAQDACQTATEAAPGSSEAQLWLGRVLGARASAANPLQAFALARKVHTAFERAVQMDGTNVAAMTDLGEFYVSAPAIVGGGVEKARQLAPRLASRDPVSGHRLLAMIARKDGDLAAEERESEAAAASGTPAGLIDLAIFRARNRQPDLAVAAARRSIQANRDRDDALVDAASILIRLRREPQLAQEALTSYLASPAKSDAAPAFKVRLQLAALRRTLGDTAGADRETAMANALAPEFAQKQKTAAALTVR